jgi:hypothetical protein
MKRVGGLQRPVDGQLRDELCVEGNGEVVIAKNVRYEAQ